MALADDLDALERDGCAALTGATDETALEAVRIDLLGRNGRLKELTKAFGAASPDDKRALGPVLNRVSTAIKQAHEAARRRLASARDEAPLDWSLPQPWPRRGTIHPITQIARDVEQVFHGMGFELVDGPHVETDEYNFNRLNIPDDHPARDAQDTVWLRSGHLLRTHTSSVQARVYPREADQLPIRKVVIGRVFRYEEVDATHDNTFNQVEGFMVDRHITVRHMVGVIRTMLSGVLGRDDVDVRLRPSFFPFVEPGFEVDVRYTNAESGSRFADWMELMGCGAVHPHVLREAGIDPDQAQGFAFGMGLERLCMIRHQIEDIRIFNGADLRALRQFGYA